MKNPFKYLRKDYIPWAFWPVLLIGAVLGSILGLLFYSSEVGALVFTAIFIAWYSIETSKLVKETKNANTFALATRKEMTLANQLSLQPCLVLEYQSDGPPWSFALKNIGKGAAINISINSDSPYSFELNGLNALKDGERGSVALRKRGKDLTTEDWQALRSNPIRATILFDRTKELNWQLQTEIAVKNPPKIEIVRKSWVPG